MADLGTIGQKGLLTKGKSDQGPRWRFNRIVALGHDTLFLSGGGNPAVQPPVGEVLAVDGNSALTTLSLASVVTIAGDISITENPALTSFSAPSWLPDNSTAISFDGCALDVTSVNHILARCVANASFIAGSVNLSGGTNAAPTGQGVTDVATLIARGVAVETN